MFCVRRNQVIHHAIKLANVQSRGVVIPTVNVSAVSPAVLPDLPYDYAALEPVLPARLMELHHGKHHAAYVANFNKGLEQYEQFKAKNDAENMIAMHKAIAFNAGGHVNHSIFWQNLAPAGRGGGGQPDGPLGAALNEKYGNFESFVEKFNAQTAAVQGSGWGWLAFSAEKGVHIATCANQDMLSAATGAVPLLGVDVWEHAYYLQYENRRPEYLKNIWKVVNWKDVESRYEAALKA
eukprot:468725_1